MTSERMNTESFGFTPKELRKLRSLKTVSYTHLTLPTNREV